MKSFKIIGIIILTMIIALFVGAFFLPNKVSVEKKIEINAPIDSVFDIVNDFHQWQNWSPWYDTSYTYNYTGSDKGVGAIIRWVDNRDQVGERTIIVSDSTSEIDVETRFREENSAALMTFEFVEFLDGKTEVTLRFAMDDNFSYPFGRYIAWMIQAGVDNSFPMALSKLKKYTEKNSKNEK